MLFFISSLLPFALIAIKGKFADIASIIEIPKDSILEKMQYKFALL